MPDYKQGKIYKLVSDECDKVYYGSTSMTLMARLWVHKSKFDEWKNNGGSRCAICKYFDEYGFDNFRIELVEDYPCDNEEQLRTKEQEYIDSNECVNERRAYRSPEVERLYNIKYREEHKEQMVKYQQEHYQANKEKKLEYLKKNREHINERLREKVVCECGMEVTKGALTKHRKSAVHQEYLNLTI